MCEALHRRASAPALLSGVSEIDETPEDNMLTEEMMRAAVQERDQAIADFRREEEWREFLRETGTAAGAPRGRTFVPSISIAGIRQFVGALGRA